MSRTGDFSYTSSMHNMFGASVSEVYNIIWCQFDLKIDNLTLMIGKKRNEWLYEVSNTKVKFR